MIAQRLAHDGVLFEVVQCLVQVAWQVVDTEATPLPVRHPRDVLVDGLPGVDLLLHTVYPGGQLHREGEIGVRRRVRHTVLAARRLAALRREADQRRHVLRGPRHVDRRLVSGHEALVRIHQWIGDRAVAARMPQQPADVAAAHFGKLDRALGVEEGVLPLGEQ